MNSRDWVLKKIEENGRDWVEENYSVLCEEVDNPVTTETYSRYIRWATSKLKMQRRKSNNKKDSEYPSVDFEQYDDNLNIVINSYDIRTLEQLLDYTRTNLAIWKVKRHRVNMWGSKENPSFQVRAELERRKEEPKESIIEEFKKDAFKYSPQYPKIKRRKQNDNLLLEVSIPDAHLGLLAWGEETGDANYDIKIAKEKYIECVDNIIQICKVYPIKKILFPIGNDFFNVDSAENTTFSGTPQHEDCRYQKSFTLGRQMAVQAIDMLLTIANIEIPIIPGNHDLQRSYYLGESLYSWYRNTDQVIVDNRPLLRKYYKWGKCLIGLDHGTKSGGRKKKPDDAPLIMASEVPELWGETEFREMHTGHLHSYSVMEKMGVRVLVLPSLAPSSAWSYAEGYKHLKEAQAHLWHKEKGKILTTYYKPTYEVERI